MLKKIICRLFHSHKIERWTENSTGFLSVYAAIPVSVIIEELACRDCGRLIKRKEYVIPRKSC